MGCTDYAHATGRRLAEGETRLGRGSLGLRSAHATTRPVSRLDVGPPKEYPGIEGRDIAPTIASRASKVPVTPRVIAYGCA